MGIKKIEEFEVNFIQDIKRLLASNLTTKGQASVATETLTALVNKVANVETTLKLTVGENLIARADTSKSILNTNTKVKEVKMNYTGIVRVRFDLRVPFVASGRVATGQVYINGVPKGIVRTTTSDFATTYTEDFNVNINDLVQLYIYSSVSGYPAEGKNFRIFTTQLALTELLLD